MDTVYSSNSSHIVLMAPVTVMLVSNFDPHGKPKKLMVRVQFSLEWFVNVVLG